MRLLPVAVLLVACTSSVTTASVTPARANAPITVLFDDSKAETAGNADWIISTAMPDPTAEDASPAGETDWTGALSSWGVALQRTGSYQLRTLPPGSSITASALSGVDVFVLPEPNVLLSAAEKSAVLSFVQNGGGLFMISDHNDSDRNNDGADSIEVLNGLMSGNPFGIRIDTLSISSENPDVLGSSDDVLDGPFGPVTGTIIRSGTTATLSGAAKGEVYRSGYAAGGTTGAAFATSTYGSGRVAFWGDSSPIDDGTGQSGNELFDGWNDPAGTDAALALNATAWLSGGTSTGGGGAALSNGGFEAGSAPWTLGGGAAVVTSQHHGGTHALHLGSTTSSTDSATQSIVVPSSGSLTWWTRMTTTETGTSAADVLSVRLGPTTVATLSNTGATATWSPSTVSLAGYAGQTVTLSFSASNNASSPSTFWVDDVAVG